MNKLLPSIVFLILFSIKAYCCTSTITIAATAPANDTVCAGATIEYTATIVANGGTGASRQWQVNSINVTGANGATYTFAPAPGDVVTCILTNSCGTVTSNSLHPAVKPVLDQIPSETFCGGSATSPVSLYGATWTNSNTAIGLGANGTGDIPSFTTVNSGTTPVTATIMAIQTCSVTDTAVFLIIIDPIPTVDSVSNQVVCAGSSTASINFAGPQPYTVFNWTGSNSNIGLASSGTDSIPAFTAINGGGTPIVDTITVTPFTSGYAYMTDAINGYGYVVSRAYDTLISSINLETTFFNGGIGITVSSDGNWVYIANNGANTVSVINATNNTLANTINVGNEPWGIVVSPDGNYVYVANSGDGTIQAISTVTDTVIATLLLSADSLANPEGIAISPDGSRLYVAGATDIGQVYFINTATFSLFDSVTVDSIPSGIIVSPDGGKVYVANNWSRNISAITVSTGQVTTSAVFTNTIPTQIENNGLALSPDGLTLYVSSFWDGTVIYYNTATNPPTLLGTIDLPGGSGEAPVGLSMSSDGQYLYVSNCGDGYYTGNYSSLEVISTSTEKVVYSDVINNNIGEEISFSFGNFVTGVSCTGTPYTFTITVNPAGGQPAANLEITSGSQTVCSGSLDTFIAVPSDFATVTSYNFEVNGTSVQNGTSATYATDSINNNDTVTCVITGTDCSGSASVTSNDLIMTVLTKPGVVPSVTATPNTYHPGDNVVIVATPPTPDPPGTLYKFIEAFPQSGGIFLQVQDTTGDTLILNDVTAYGTSIKSPGVTWLFVYANNACGQATGAFYQISVIPPTTFVNPTACGDTDGYITFPGLIADNQYTVNYDLNGVAQSQLTLTTDAGGVLTIPDLGAGTYSNIQLQVLNQGSSSLSAPADPVVLVAPCGGLTAFNVTYNNGLSTQGLAAKVCAGIANIGLANADSGVIYQLYEGANVVASDTPSKAGAFNFVYTPLAGNTYTVTATVSPSTVSMDGSVIVNANPVAVISDSGLTGCSSPGVALGTIGSSAGSGSISSYQWKNTSGAIGGATGSSYTATATDSYSVIVTNSNSCSDTSSAVAVTAISLADTVTLSDGSAGNICSGTNVTFTATSVNGGTTPIYNFTLNGVSVQNGTDASYSDDHLNNNDTVNVMMTSSEACVTPSTASASGIIVKVMSVISTTVNHSICSGQSFDGYNQPGTFIDTFIALNGCDSIRTLNLITQSVTSDTIVQTICQGQSFEGHDTAGVYVDTLLASGGCDSVIRTLNLATITPMITSGKEIICKGDTFNGHTTTGIYTDTTRASGGCDSVILVLELQVLPLSAVPVITQNGDTLISTPATSYAWYADSTLLADTGRILIISDTGQYTVVVTDSSSCATSSQPFNATTTGLNNINAQPLIAVYPDPASDILNIRVSQLSPGDAITVRLYDGMGKLIWYRSSASAAIYTTQVPVTELSEGMYFLNVQQGNWNTNKKVLISR